MKKSRLLALLCAFGLLGGLAIGPTSQPAVAEPNATKIFDNSGEARKNHYLWYKYEVLVPYDATVDERVIFTAGVTVCVGRNANKPLSAIKKYVSEEYGLELTSAEAVIKGALKALCPWYNNGYKTYFDKNVAIFMTGARSDARLIFPAGYFPPEFDFGWFMKGACDYYNKTGGTYNIDIWMFQNQSQWALINGQTNVNVVRLYLEHAMGLICGQPYIA